MSHKYGTKSWRKTTLGNFLPLLAIIHLDQSDIGDKQIFLPAIAASLCKRILAHGSRHSSCRPLIAIAKVNPIDYRIG